MHDTRRAALATAESLERRALLTAEWDGSASGSWADTANWVGGVTPETDSIVRFPSSAANKNNVNDLGPLTLTQLTIVGSGYTIGSGSAADTITFNGNGLVIETVSSTNTFNAAVETGFGSAAFTVADQAVLTYGGVLTGTGAGELNKNGIGRLDITSGSPDFDGFVNLNTGTLRVSHPEALGSISGETVAANVTTLELTPAAAGGDEILNIGGTGFDDRGALRADATLDWDGDVFINRAGTTIVVEPAGSTLTLDGDLGGGDSIVKQGAGTLALAGAGYSVAGGSVVEAGVLSFRADGSSGSLTVNSGAAVHLQGGANVSASGTLTINGTGVGGTGAIVNVSGTNSWDGGTVLAATNTEIGSLAGLLTLTGTLNTGSPTGRTVSFSGAGITTVNSTVTGNGSIIKDDAGTLVLGGTGANTYTGTTTVNAGVLNIRKSSALGGTTNGTTVDAGAVLQVQGGIAVGAESLRIEGAGVSPGNAGVLLNVSGSNSWAGDITLNNAAATIGSTSGTLTINGDIDNDGFLLTVTGAGTVVVNGQISGSGGLTKTGGGTLVLASANTYTGATTVSAGVLEIEDAGSLGGGAGATTVAAGATLRLDGTGTVNEQLTLNGTGVGGAGALVNVAGNNTWSGDVTLAGDTTIAVTGGSLTISGDIGGGATADLTKIGNNDLTLTADNTNAGRITVATGRLVARGIGALGAGGNPSSTSVLAGARLSFGPDVGVTANVTFNEALNLDGTLDALSNTGFTSTWAGNMLLGGTPTWDAGAGTPFTITSAVAGNGGPTKTGAGLLTLAGAGDNAWNGVTRVDAGTLALNKTAGQDAVPDTNLIIGLDDHSGAATAQLLADNQIPDITPITINGAGLLDLNGNDDTVGPLTMVGGNIETDAGLLTLNGNVTAASVTISTFPNVVTNDPVITGSVNVGTTATVFDVGPATGLSGSTLRINGAISGTGGIKKNGLQTLLFDGSTDNTYTGTTQVNAGFLVLSKTGGTDAIGIGGALIVGNNALDGAALPLDTVRWDRNNQLPNDTPISVNASGVLNLANNGDTLGPITMIGGLVQTGTGLLTLNGQLSGESSDIGPDPVAPSRVTGHLALGNVLTRDIRATNGDGPLDLVIEAVISGAAVLRKVGTGALELAGDNTYTGNTTASTAGELYITGTTGNVSAALGDLGGNGDVGSLGIGLLGALTPGTVADATAQMRTTGNLGFGNDAGYEVDLGATGIGSFDQVQTGNLANVELGNDTNDVVRLTVRITASFGAIAGASFRIIDNTGAQPVAGRFFQLPEGAAIVVPHPSGGTRTFNISYRGGDGNDVVLRVAGGAPANLPPTIASLSDSPDPINAGQTMTLTANTVVDPDGDGINRVEFFRESNALPGLQIGTGGDTPVGTDTNAAGGYTAAVDTTGLAGGQHTYYARASDNAPVRFNSDPVSTTNTVQVTTATVAGRHVFYNNGALDGNDPGANAADDAAIDAIKQALISGAPTPANHTAMAQGLNGIMVDIANLAPGVNPTAADFTFRTGPGGDPATWQPAPTPTATVRRDAGVGGSDRVTLTWSDATSVKDAWLQVTVLANANTRLASPDVFYYGNLIADATGDRQITVADVGVVSTNFGLANRTPAQGDFTGDRQVSVADVGALSTAFGHSLGVPTLGAIVESGGGNATGAIAPAPQARRWRARATGLLNAEAL